MKNQVNNEQAIQMLEEIAVIEKRVVNDVVLEILNSNHTLSDVYHQVTTQKDLITNMVDK